MKKIYILGLTVLFCLAIVACSKENKVQTSDKITVKAITEDVNTSGSKVSISESGTHFSLNWEGTETFGVANSTNNNEKKSGDSWTINSHSGTNASISGTLPSADGVTANYIFSNNYFSSAGGSGGVVRVVVPSTQNYNGSVLANYCLLIARADGATVGTLPGSLSFKTMNGFLKFSLVKGSAAPGSSNDYTHMYVQSIVVEAIGHEDIAGRFEVSKTAADWATSGSYAGTVAGYMSDKITLNCTSVNSDGEELSAVAKDFYVAVAFGDYASGIKVTINVKNDLGKFGKLEKTFGTVAGVTIGRNKMKALSSLTVNPVDVKKSYSLTFPDDNSASNKVGSYTATWTATKGTTSWSITNFNNNNWLSSWTYIKCGNKNAASVGTITTSSTITEKIKTVDVYVDAFTSGKVNSFKLYVATNATFTENLQTIAHTIATGKNTFTVPLATANCYYKIEVDCAQGSKNGLVQISSITYTEE